MEDLQGLLEKINRDGVAKAEAAAKEIVSAAEAKAAAIAKTANEEADRARQAAQAEAKAWAERSEATLKQAARDVVLKVREAVSRELEQLLVKSVNGVLADEATLTALVTAAVRDLTGPGEIAVSAKLAPALAAKLAAGGAFKVVTDESAGAGFTVRLDQGRVEHDYTASAIADELKKRLRPELAKLL